MMNFKKNKNEKAITLISLIITIIVLLIISGVVINLTMGDNGIIGKVQTAVGKYENEQKKEEIGINKLTNELDYYLRTERENNYVTRAEIEEIVEKKVTERLNTFGISTQKTSNTITATAANFNEICSINLTEGKYLLLGEIRERTLNANYIDVRFSNCDYTTNSSTPSSDEININWKDLTINGFVDVKGESKKIILEAYSRKAISISGSIIAIKLP